jgi:hypothetical protein
MVYLQASKWVTLATLKTDVGGLLLMLGQRAIPAGSSTDEGGLGDLPSPFPRGDDSLKPLPS